MRTNLKPYVLTGAGSEIDDFDVADTYSGYSVTGTATAIGNYTISITGTPVRGDIFVLFWNAVLDLNGNTFSILGESFTSGQLNRDGIFTCVYDGSAWNVTYSGDNVWSLGGNAGTTAGTNFIGTTDNVDLVFKTNSIVSGRISSANADNNASIGRQSLLNRTTGVRDTAFGANTLNQLTTGNYNTALGAEAGVSITTGSGNVAVGDNALTTLLGGSNNTCIGFGSDVDSFTASNRIALGYLANATSDNQFALPDTVTTFKWRGITYTMPSVNAAGVLTNDGAGNLTWS